MTSKTPPKPAAAPRKLRVLGIAADDLRDPQKFAQWQFSHAPLILQELFDNLPAAAANERVRVLADLYKTCLSYRPYATVVGPNGGSDPAAELAALLAAPVEEKQ
jgi:hypothetical protein